MHVYFYGMKPLQKLLSPSLLRDEQEVSLGELLMVLKYQI